ncbi:unnamed protein product [Lupinus luteus]|uniref:Uncharacterized protein n=1 Tax=Lupinus luteus TaxID=3873 RepID=A0AAV1XMH9_LUPLU
MLSDEVRNIITNHYSLCMTSFNYRRMLCARKIKKRLGPMIFDDRDTIVVICEGYWRTCIRGLKGDVVQTYKWFEVHEGLLEKVINLLLMMFMETWSKKVNRIEA